MQLGESVENFKQPISPCGIVLAGAHLRIEPLDTQKHGADLFQAFQADESERGWTYLPYGPFASQSDFLTWLHSMQGLTDPVFFALIRKSDNKALGVASFLRIDQAMGVIEVGHIHFSVLMQRSILASEAMYLMMKWVFEQGYRRYEWKCNSLNLASRQAAQRLGFSYEGLFRQARMDKGRNRDTAWFAIIDKEWPALKACFERYLSPQNFDQQGRALTSLRSMTKALLFQHDPQITP